ncbi:MAG: C-GCAxxG-C-C family protein [Bacteroidales bacterium]|nr:C-GCAxxG-C-C family protein [Bacteroidales bacterium]
MQIDIEERERRAMRLFREGNSCSQSVALAFSDIIRRKQGLTEDQIRAVMSGFGGGFGRLREVCGTFSGMTFVAGAVCPVPAAGSSPEAQELKTRNYELVQSLAKSFREENGSIICRELLNLRVQSSSPVPSERTPEFYKTRPCERLVGAAARILAARLSEID